MRYRQLDANGDRVFGSGLSNFWINTPEAPAQAAMTRLRLISGEWFLDVGEGTAWDTRILGNRTGSIRDVELQARLLGTTGISAIISYSSVTTPDRHYNVTTTLDTIYGRVTLAGSV